MEADSFALCAQNDKPFSFHECREVCAVSYRSVIAKEQSDCGNSFSFKVEADSFALCAQNDKPFSFHECREVCTVSYRSVIAKEQNGCGNPFSFKGNYGFFHAAHSE